MTTISKGVGGAGLAGELAEFSRALWRLYCRAQLTLRDRRGQTVVQAAVGAVEAPEPLTSPSSSFDEPLVQRGHSLGRFLQEAGEPGLSQRMIAECRTEIKAARSADNGVLEGRAAQALRLWRLDAPSQRQIDVASSILDRTLFNPDGIGTVEPTAACVAIIPWPEATLRVVARRTGLKPSEVILRADDIEPTPSLPIEVTDRYRAGESAQDIVRDLVRDAADAAASRSPSKVRAVVAAVAEHMVDVPIDQQDLRHLCLLDPLNPAADLKENLLHGIWGAWRVAEDDYLTAVTRRLPPTGNGRTTEEGLDDAEQEVVKGLAKRYRPGFRGHRSTTATPAGSLSGHPTYPRGRTPTFRPRSGSSDPSGSVGLVGRSSSTCGHGWELLAPPQGRVRSREGTLDRSSCRPRGELFASGR